MIISPAFVDRQVYSRKMHMHNIAAALAIAISYLDRRPSTASEDDDIETVEAIAAELRQASPNERDELMAALVHIGRADLIDGLGFMS
ncbi:MULTISPECIES: hypothetical protein [Rhizobium]|uniref:Uncharacterized protein n=1 Tax=Rhizobium rhododendri TaxID=2506430 RepID=A0ABY8IMK2_9HYPH|nr:MULTISPECIES: hypothetical protein [Rhizobium]MBO9096852.1 hypothetical protein [Rhizobium sp. L58/93]QXZ87355.1 hypothetical protein J5287_22715 [Rhizobium sp. K1/93]QXZ92613.1 hypothetical protein J5280_26475 [Rhizobium sp. K15/93]QYA04165.1 hypothetical protein J5278_25870 [Rhizobium sp. B21/90]TQX86759.1 hypothetical protein EQW76_16475 [Rhizobium sp. rho-13.1]